MFFFVEEFGLLFATELALLLFCGLSLKSTYGPIRGELHRIYGVLAKRLGGGSESDGFCFAASHCSACALTLAIIFVVAHPNAFKLYNRIWNGPYSQWTCPVFAKTVSDCNSESQLQSAFRGGVVALQEFFQACPQQSLLNWLGSADFNTLGKQAYEYGQFADAITAELKAIELNKWNPEAHCYLGLAYCSFNQPRKCAEEKLTARRIDARYCPADD